MTASVLSWRLAGWSAALPARPSPPRAPLQAVERSRSDGLRERDHDCWNQLFDQHGQDVYRYMVSRLGEPAQAEDATSEVFEAAWKSAESFEDRGLPVRAWLFGIARHVVANHRRSWRRRVPELSLQGFDAGALEGALAAERLDLARAIAQLPPGYGAVIVLRFVQGLTLQETAGALGTTTDSVKGRQLRALAALRVALSVAD